jgi:hypothetical protein
LDIKSVINFQRYRPIGSAFDEICFSGGSRSNKYQVEFYFKDKKLEEFSYPIHKRYEKLVDKGVKSLMKVDQEKDMKIAPWTFVYESLSEWSLSYDSSEGVRPAGYFKKCFEYLKREYYRKGATTSLPVGIELDKAIEDKKGSEASRHDQFDAEQKQNIPKEQLKSKQTEIILGELCKDEMDRKIIDLLKDRGGRFKTSGEINYSAIAKELDTYPKDISRRLEEFRNEAKKHPDLRDFFKK